MSKLIYSPKLQLKEFRRLFYMEGTSVGDLGDQLIYVTHDYRVAVKTLTEANKFIQENELPLKAVGNSLGFKYHAIYIKTI